jgi:hypothetical protein
MMSKMNKGSNHLPDFHQLNDRIIAEPSDEPSLVIKTNLDPKTPTENNPYIVDQKIQDKNKFNQYFNDDGDQ